MPCLFVREFHGHNSFTLTKQVTPGCEWVLAGEGTASRKRDGTACRFTFGEYGGKLWKRYDAKRDRKTGEYKAPPAGAVPCGEPDPVTGHWPHWAPLVETDYWHWDAFNTDQFDLIDGVTYELCGPKLQGNPERLERHTLIRHGEEGMPGLLVRSFDGLRAALEELPWEGIVFAHPDGRYAKIRRADFGLPWPCAAPTGGEERDG